MSGESQPQRAESAEPRLASSGPEHEELPLDARASELTRRKTTVVWSPAIHHRLDKLVTRAHAVRAERSEILEALVGAAPEDEQELEQLVLSWRRMTVREVLSATGQQGETIQVPLHRRGRRKKQRI
jgi:hypothetical protein